MTPVLLLYDRGIAGCLRRDAQQVSAVLLELIAALDFDHESAAMALFRLYDGCLRKVKAGQFEVPLRILRELHAASALAIAASPRHDP